MSYTRLLGLRIRQVPLFQHLAGKELEEIEASSSTKKFEAGNILADENSSPDHMMMILSGSVDIRKNYPDGTETIMRRLGPPTMFGYCLLSGQPYTAAIVAADMVVASFFPLVKTKNILIRQPETLLTVIGHLSSLVDSLSQERIELKRLPLKDRIYHVLDEIRSPDGTCSISHEELGQLVGGSRSNVSRALKELETVGKLKLGRRNILLMMYIDDQVRR